MNEQRLPFDAFQTGQCPEPESALRNNGIGNINKFLNGKKLERKSSG